MQHDVLAHFAAEEEVMFPAFEAASGMSCGPTAVMRMEHAEARELLDDLAAATQVQDTDGVRGHAEALLILLQQHNMKEENILYPAAISAAGPIRGGAHGADRVEAGSQMSRLLDVQGLPPCESPSTVFSRLPTRAALRRERLRC
ncbi:MAG: hemerythrin domain-containing protein [Uliginosibacterium sp.]|nr:hemerythrin domain-containing protein [Uliginosibacterium sp.]